MRIAVIGRGRVGQAIGEGWRRVGHDVVYGVRSRPAQNEATVLEAATSSDVLALATPCAAVPGILTSAGDLVGKIILDCTNPLPMIDGRLQLAPPSAGSAAQQIAALAPGALVFKTLNQTGAEIMADARRFEAAPVMFVAGDDPEAKPTVLRLVADLGFDAVDAGPLANAGLLEGFAMLWIDQALVRGHGRDWAFGRLAPR